MPQILKKKGLKKRRLSKVRTSSEHDTASALGRSAESAMESAMESALRNALGYAVGSIIGNVAGKSQQQLISKLSVEGAGKVR